MATTPGCSTDIRAVVQRVSAASVHVGDELVGEIAQGFTVLVAVGHDDRPEDGERLAAKIAALRVFDDDRGHFDRTLADVKGEVLVIPQFTLYADPRRGRRPDFAGAAPPEKGERLYDAFCGVLRGQGLRVASGRFGARMRVRIDGDGPVTIVVSTDGWAEADLGRGGA